MSDWDIDTDGVRTVLTNTGTAAGKLEGEATSYSSHLQSAATDAGTITKGGVPLKDGGGLVAVALSMFAEHTQTDLQFVAARAGKSMTGAVNATTAYTKGDLDMAADAQKQALAAPDMSQFAKGNQPDGPSTAPG